MSLYLRRASLGVALLAFGVSPVFAQQSAPATPPPTSGAATPEPVVPPVKAAPKKPVVKLPENIVARVGGQDITRDQALALFNTVGGRPIVDQLVQATIIQQEAKKLGVSVSEAELKARIEDTKKRIVQQAFNMRQPGTFEEIAEREGFNNDLIRWSVRQDLLRRKTFAKSLEKSPQIQSRENQVKLAHILVATMPLPNPDGTVPANDDPKKREADAKTKVDALYADIKAGKIQWNEAAKQSDDKSNADKGGELDFYNATDLDPEFAKAGWAIQKPGDIVGPVKSRFGYHIIKLIQKGRDLPAKEKAAFRQGQIDQIVSNPEAQQQWLQGLQRSRNVILNRAAKIVPGAKLMQPGTTPATPPAKRPAARRAASLR